jgi:hypothetical protein
MLRWEFRSLIFCERVTEASNSLVAEVWEKGGKEEDEDGLSMTKWLCSYM